MSEYTFHVDGELVSATDATVSVRDRGFMYGDAAFETLRAYGGWPFEWDAHVRRLRQSCETLGFGDAVPPDDDLLERIRETLSANDLSEAYVRLSVTRGVQPGKLTPDDDVDPTIVVVVSSLPRGGRDGERVWDEPAHVEFVETRKPPDSSIPAAAKTHNYLNGILARLALRDTDADEALLCSTDGLLAEGTTSNVFFVDDGVLKTPSVDRPLLPGITRQVVLEEAESEGVPVETGWYEPTTVLAAEEVFLTNSTWEIRPVSRLDNQSFDTGPITEQLQRMFDARIERQHYE